MASLISQHPEVEGQLSARAQRAKLLDAMVRVVGEKGFANATVADAVRLAKVSRGTFYELFESKEACLAYAYRLGTDVLAERISVAIKDAADWREELRLGLRTYLETLEAEPLFARVYLLESPGVVAAERDAGLRRFAKRYGATFARSGRPAPPDDALFILSAGIHELACSRVRAGVPVTDLEDTMVGCAVRLVAEEDSWT